MRTCFILAAVAIIAAETSIIFFVQDMRENVFLRV